MYFGRKKIITLKLRKMKKYIFIAFAASLTLASCSKDWTCTCQYSVDGVDTGEPNVTTILNTTKEIAGSGCIGGESEDGVYKNVCELKGK